ncbi:unnamed protein product [Cuscuta europaea]|uniref:Uncharacterized protein n=1 Tax=Cuscuta europaea TaxID=41803 RepID=A0A9P1E391_CUSEU|nr:unnamed protein product [Cuscuta europaea]
MVLSFRHQVLPSRSSKQADRQNSPANRGVTKDFNYYMQKAQLAKQKEQGVVLMAEHDRWLEDSEDSEPENLALMARVTESGTESDDSEEEDNGSTSAENEALIVSL